MGLRAWGPPSWQSCRPTVTDLPGPGRYIRRPPTIATARPPWPGAWSWAEVSPSPQAGNAHDRQYVREGGPARGRPSGLPEPAVRRPETEGVAVARGPARRPCRRTRAYETQVAAT